jgi:stalled ribosome rescue protein Dom34
MTEHFHALVWIDNREAKIFRFTATSHEQALVSATHPDQHIHTKAHSGGSGHSAVDHAFFERVAAALASVGAVLIVGPGNAKTELAKHIKQKHPPLAARISAVEPADHPPDGELLKLGRTFYRADDRMRSQV